MKRLVTATLIVAGCWPVLAYGQAGLFWDNSEKLRSSAGNGWDSGNRGTSAVGQLESMTGQKIDTSRSTSTQPTQTPRPKAVKRPVLSMKQQVGLMLFESLFEQVLSDSLFGDNSAASAQAQEQQRLAAERLRQEQLRKARLLHAQWRAEWDARDQTTTEQLAGVFDAVSTSPSGSVHRSFFGLGANVDPKALLADVDLFADDASVVDLRDASSLTVSLLRPVEPSVPKLPLSVPPPPPSPRQMLAGVKPGHVILVEPDPTYLRDPRTWFNESIRLTDRLLSWQWDSPAGHTLTCVGEFKGRRYFLDDQPGQGPRVISEDLFLETYGHRGLHRAALGRQGRLGLEEVDLTADQTAKLWRSSIALAQTENLQQLAQQGDLWIDTRYGTARDDMVCSELSRWALAEAGLNVAPAASLAMRALSIDMAPADFSDPRQWIVSRLQ